MTRVVHVVVAGEIGGAERMLVDLGSPAQGGDVRHSVCVLSPRDDVADLFRDAGLAVVARRSAEGPLPFLKQSFGGAHAEWIASVLRSEQADLAHLHTFASHVVGTRAARAAGVPVVRTEHSTRAFVDPTCRPFAAWSLARATVSISVSRHVRDVAASRAPWALPWMRVVPNGVDVERFAYSPAPTGGPLRLAIVGRLEPRKGVDLAIEAVARVQGVELDVVGEGERRAFLEGLARRRGAADRVRFLGFASDVRPAIAACHAVLCTSRTEGLGLALLEAMSMGRPVLGFRVGGVTDVVDDRLGALLGPPGDVPSLAASLARCVSGRERLRDLGGRARTRVVERFSSGAMCAAYGHAYADALAGPTARLP
jgi:glycosyltransferase involved in cell wall biosynthesis